MDISFDSSGVIENSVFIVGIDLVLSNIAELVNTSCAAFK